MTQPLCPRCRRHYTRLHITEANELILYGLAEAAEYLEVSRVNLRTIRSRGQMIAPAAELKCGPIWSQSQLDEQLYLWQRKPKKKRTAD
jgi:hypothetical protein